MGGKAKTQVAACVSLLKSVFEPASPHAYIWNHGYALA